VAFENTMEDQGLFAFEEGPYSLVMNITSEGIIFDCWFIDEDGQNDTHVGTRGMTFDEWYDFIINTDPLGKKEYMTDSDFESAGRRKV